MFFPKKKGQIVSKIIKSSGQFFQFCPDITF